MSVKSTLAKHLTVSIIQNFTLRPHSVWSLSGGSCASLSSQQLSGHRPVETMDRSPDKLPLLWSDIGAEMKRQVLQEAKEEIADEMKQQLSGHVKQLSKQVKELTGEVAALKKQVKQQNEDWEDIAEYNQDTEDIIDDKISDKLRAFEHELGEQKRKVYENTSTIVKLDKDRTEMRMDVA